MEQSSEVFEYTFTAKFCIEHIVSFLRNADVEPRPIIEELLSQFESRVGQFPLGSQICPELVKIGCAKYREFNSAGGYRVLYSVEEHCITAHAILSQRQDIKQFLFTRLIQP